MSNLDSIIHQSFLFGCSDSMKFLTPNYFSRPLFYVTDTQPWLHKFTSSTLYSNYFLLLSFIPFFHYLTVCEATVGTQPLTTQNMCYIRNAMLCHWSQDASQPLSLVGGGYHQGQQVRVASWKNYFLETTGCPKLEPLKQGYKIFKIKK